MIKPVVALLLATSVTARNPGLGGSIDQVGINNAKNIIAPIIFDHLKDILIPEIDITNGKFSNLDL
jgi:hypothetical protein